MHDMTHASEGTNQSYLSYWTDWYWTVLWVRLQHLPCRASWLCP